MANLRQTLYAWRDNEAAKRGVELFRILPNSALDEITKALPRTKEELTSIKGIKDAKYQHYGKAILAMVDEVAGEVQKFAAVTEQDVTSVPLQHAAQEQTVLSVGAYLDIVNHALWRLSARVKGEITSLKFQGSALYMGIKDTDDASMMNVFMWVSDYEIAGIELEEGMEVLIEGKSEVYKPSGRLSFRAETIELVGEGALKRAYDALKKKLDLEGIFAPERKRALPEYPESIGLITSKTGAVIHDFLNNIGKFGFHVRFADSRVEGAAAVKDLLAAITYFKTAPIDALVIIRGGGSLESLQAFNNELVVRAIAQFPKPVICAIGHDKDVPLAQLVADFAPSTPTACTALLNSSWESASALLRIIEQKLVGEMTERFWGARSELDRAQRTLADYFSFLFTVFRGAAESVRAYVPMLEQALVRAKKESEESIRLATSRYKSALALMEETLKKLAIELTTHNPLRQLKLGYSILSQGKEVLRSVHGRHVGEHFSARLADGTLDATITGISPK